MHLSVQLYSVRDALTADLPGTLHRLAGIGFTHVEPFNLVELADQLATVLPATGLHAPTTHAPLLSGDQREIFEAARRLGVGTVIEPYITEEHWQDAEAISAIADGLNAAAELGAEYGIRVGYHNHWWELEHEVDGVTALEYLAGLLDPGVVLEVDTYWAATGGAEPTALLNRLGRRVVALHLKDGPLTLDMADQQPAGQGRMDIAGVIAAVPTLEVGVIEFDDYAGDIFEGLTGSLGYVRGLVSKED